MNVSLHDVARWQRNVSQFISECSKVVFDQGFTHKNPQVGSNLYFTINFRSKNR